MTYPQQIGYICIDTPFINSSPHIHSDIPTTNWIYFVLIHPSQFNSFPDKSSPIFTVTCVLFICCCHVRSVVTRTHVTYRLMRVLPSFHSLYYYYRRNEASLNAFRWQEHAWKQMWNLGISSQEILLLLVLDGNLCNFEGEIYHLDVYFDLFLTKISENL